MLIETSRQITPLLRRIAGDGAEDVLQDVLWTVARKLTWLEDPSAFKSWIYRDPYQHRAALRHMTRERRLWPFGSREDLDAIPEPEGPTGSPHADEIPELLAHATPRSRVVIVLHYFEEMSLDEVAVVLGLPLGTVNAPRSCLRPPHDAARRQAEETRLEVIEEATCKRR